jgi:hypothetical protein
MKAEMLDKDVYEFKNFLNQDEIDAITKHLAGLKENDWIESYDNWNKRSTRLPEYLLNQIDNKINSIFIDAEIDGFGMILRHLTGDRMSVHSDNGSNRTISWGAVIYLNNDYLGGEIYYPDLDIVHKPDPGSMLLHAGNIDHGVYKVEEGIKYIMTNFIHHGYIDPNIVN